MIYFAGYRKREDLFKREWLEAAADTLVYSVDQGEPIPALRPQDRSCVGNIVEAALASVGRSTPFSPFPPSPYVPSVRVRSVFTFSP